MPNKNRKILFTHADRCIDCRTCEDACLLEHEGGANIEVVAFPVKNRYEGENHDYKIVTTDPFIVRDNNKCIMCGKCVRICDEIEGRSILSATNRAFESKIEPAFDRPLKEVGCSFCGHCVSVCPVGALVEKSIFGKDRTWRNHLLTKTKTTCPYCGVGCSMTINSKGSEIAKITSEVGQGSNNGSLCVKGRFGYEFVNSPDRLRKPLIRTNSKKSATAKFREATWEEALSLVGEKLAAARKKPETFAALSSARCTNEENYLFQKLARAVMGTNNIDHCARLCHASTVSGLVMSLGSGAMTGSISDFEKADVIFVIGSNTTEAHPIIGLRIKKAVADKKAKLIVADPRGIELTGFSDIWLRQRPGTDVALLNGMMNAIVHEQHEKDRKFIHERTENYEEFFQAIKDFTPEKAEEITGVPAGDIRKAAHMFKQAGAACIVYSMGITQHTTGVDNVLSISNMALLTGQIGRPGTGVYPLRGQNNVQGACDLGALPNVYPGYQNVADEKARKKFEKVWGVKLPAKPGLTVNEIIEAIYNKEINTLYIMGENPVLSDPDSNHVKKSLAKLDFLVVQDIFLTETGQFADVVLPAASWAEKEGTFTNTERRVQMVRPALPQVGESKPDWEIIGLIGQELGTDMLTFQSPRNIFREMATLTPQYAGMGYGRFEEEGGLQWPCPTPDHPGTPTLHTEKFTRGLGRFFAVEFRPPAEKKTKEYPFILTTGRILQHYHTGTMTRRVKGLNHVVPEAYVEINPADAAKLGAKEGTRLKVASKRGEIVIKARVTERMAPGEVFIPFHFAEASANVLTAANLDPIAKIPEFKVSAVKITKAR